MTGRLRRWLRYSRALAAMLREHEDAGYRVSAPSYARMRDEARQITARSR